MSSVLPTQGGTPASKACQQAQYLLVSAALFGNVALAAFRLKNLRGRVSNQWHV